MAFPKITMAAILNTKFLGLEAAGLGSCAWRMIEGSECSIAFALVS
jgi:hypothetical protein